MHGVELPCEFKFQGSLSCNCLKDKLKKKSLFQEISSSYWHLYYIEILQNINNKYVPSQFSSNSFDFYH
jgi:hypothetical protein